MAYLLAWYWEAAWGTTDGMRWADVKAWAELTGREVGPMEAEALMGIDIARRFPGEEGDENA